MPIRPTIRHAVERPERFLLTPGHPLWDKCVFAGLGQFPRTGKFIDDSPYGNHGTLTNMAIPGTATSGWGWDAELGRAKLGFVSASNQYIVLPYIPPTYPFWFSAWCKYTSGVGTVVGIGKNGSRASANLLVLVSNKCIAQSVDDAASAHNANSPTVTMTGVWRHCFAEFRSTSYRRAWIDGVAGTANTTSKTITGEDSAWIGAAEDGSQYMDGFLSDVIIGYGIPTQSLVDYLRLRDPMLNGAIRPPVRMVFPAAAAAPPGGIRRSYAKSRHIPSLSEIMSVSASGGLLSEAPHLWDGLVGAWPLQEGAGTTAFDASGYGNNGTLTNMESTDWIVWDKGRALDFGGVDERIAISAPQVGETNFSLVCWANLTGSADAYYSVVGKNGVRPDGFSIKADTGRQYVQDKNDAITAHDWGDIADIAGWHLWSWRVPGTAANIQFGRDNQFAGKDFGSYGGTTWANVDSIAAGYDQEFVGQIGPLWIWDRYLAESEIAQLYSDSWAMFRRRQRVFAAAAPATTSGRRMTPRPHKVVQRPDNFVINPAHPLWRKCVFAMLGRLPHTKKMVDSSLHDNHGTLVNMETTDWIDGGGCKAMSMDGVNEHATFAKPFDVQAEGAFGFACWYRRRRVVNYEWLFCEQGTGNNNNEIELYMQNTQSTIVVAYWAGASGRSMSVANTVIDKWMHVAFTFSAAGGTMWLNGEVVDTEPANSIPAATGATWYLGTRPALDYFFQGDMKDVLVWKRVLTQAEVTLLAQSGPMLDGAILSPGRAVRKGVEAAPPSVASRKHFVLCGGIGLGV